MQLQRLADTRGRQKDPGAEQEVEKKLRADEEQHFSAQNAGYHRFPGKGGKDLVNLETILVGKEPGAETEQQKEKIVGQDKEEYLFMRFQGVILFIR